MKLDLKNLIAAKEESVCFSYTTDLSQVEFYGEHPFRTPVHIDGEVRNHLGVLKLSASVQALYSTQCSRCLSPIESEMDVDYECVLAKDEQYQEEDDEIYLLDSDFVEVDDVVVPELLLQVPMVSLCKPDCMGLCPTCGQNLNEGKCDCKLTNNAVDSRMALLQKLLNSDEDDRKNDKE